FEFRAIETGDDLGISPPEFFGHGLEQFEGDYVDTTTHFSGDVFSFRMESDGNVGGNGQGRSGPDKAEDLAARERGIDERRVRSQGETNPDGRAGVVLVLDFRFGQRGAVVNA